jgi:DNA-binding PadR family transcriptional regulator
MQEPSFLILTSLAAGAKHGYAVSQDVKRLSEGRVVVRAGTLYTALDRLTEEGLVEVTGEEVIEGRLRRYYRLTDGGALRLADEAQRMRRNASFAIGRLGLGGASS